jgi:hypothetical protein
VNLSSWPEIGSDGDVLMTPYVPKGITGYDDDDIEHHCNYKEVCLHLLVYTVTKSICLSIQGQSSDLVLLLLTDVTHVIPFKLAFRSLSNEFKICHLPN